MAEAVPPEGPAEVRWLPAYRQRGGAPQRSCQVYPVTWDSQPMGDQARTNLGERIGNCKGVGWGQADQLGLIYLFPSLV